MPTRLKLDHVERVLRDHVASGLPGSTIEVQPPSRWKRPVVIIRWEGFAGLLAEQRFRRVMQRIPTQTLEQDLQGLIWFELTPEERVDDYLRMPRSEDVKARADDLLAKAQARGFLAKLRKALGDDAADACDGDFSASLKVLKGLKWSKDQARDLCLAIIGKGAYCDCEALEVLEQE